MRCIGSVSAVALAMGIALPAQAQDQGIAASDANGGIADIIVTAQRRQENLQKAALAVSALDSKALVNAGISQPQDLSKVVPALKLSTSGGAGTQVTVRGVGNFAGNPYAEPAVAINLDGIYMARSGGPNGLFYDLERVEVLKGPQGTLYGRNATAGALNIITRKPERDYAASGTLEAGNYDLWRGVLALNMPLGDMAAVRLSGTISRRDGYLSDGYLDDRTEGLRGQLLLEPNDRLSVLVMADYAHVGGKGPASVFSPYLASDPYTGPTKDGSNEIARNVSLAITGGTNPNLLPQYRTDGFVDVSNWGVSAKVDYRFDGASLTFLPAYRHSKSDYRHYSAGFPVASHEVSKATSLELRMASDDEGGPFQWLVGGYYFNEDLGFSLFANQGVAFNRTEPDLTTRSLAAFGQLSFSLSDTLRLTGGLRYTNEKKTQAGRNGAPPPPVPDGFPGSGEDFYAQACTPYDSGTGACYFRLAGRLKAEKLTWKAGVEYDAGPRSLLYAHVGTGFKAGGFFGSLEPNTFRPELLTAWTIGSKNRFFDNSLQLNAEAFYWVYKNKQITHVGPIRPGGFNLITENAGKAEIYGAEVELLWEPTRDDSFTANVQYLHSQYKDFTYTQTTVTGPAQTACPVTPVIGEQAVTVNCTGNTLPLSPRWTANLGYRHSFRFESGARVDAQVGTRIESKYWVGEEYLPGQLQRSVMVSNASLSWHAPADRFSISAFIDNIEDKAVKSAAFVQPVIGLPMVMLRPPRTYGVRLGFDF